MDRYKSKFTPKRKILRVHFEGGSEHHHISKVEYEDQETLEKIDISTVEMIKFIKESSCKVFVQVDEEKVEVHVINAEPKYLRTKANGIETDNLLNLETF